MTSGKSLFKGSPAPGPVPKGHIRLYSMRFCPFAQRTRLVLSAKGIKCDTVNIHLKDKPEWFLEKNPFGTVPVLETSSGQVIYESPITCDYLDEVYADRKLIPADPYEKAQQKMTLELFSKIIPYFYKIPAEKRNGKDILQLEAELNDNLAKLNKTLASKKSKFFGGDSVTMIDYMIWPWFERLEAYGVKHCVEKTPELKKWIACMLEDRAVKETMHSPDAHKAFFKSYTDGKPNYDYGL